MKKAVLRSAMSLWKSFPLILGTVLLVSLAMTFISASSYVNSFGSNIIVNSFIGSLIGSISVGNPIISYIFGGELLDQGIGLIVVTAFLVSWVTVGVIEIPAESAALGKKFAFYRNMSAFFLSILVALIVVFIYNKLCQI